MAKAREPRRIQLLGVTGRSRSELLRGTALQAATMLVLALPAAAQVAPNARPTGGSVVAGSATIGQTATTTTINQSSQNAAINWQSFNVGGQQAVTFNQPSASAVALNRVIGPDPSRIAGRIDANGQIVLVNQAGVTFYKGAQVNAQSLIVTSANVSDKDFMAGRMAFTQPGNPNARIVNHGEITVKQAGLAAFVAPSVANSGTINAKLGHVVLAGAKTATLDLYGDGLLALDVSNRVTQVPAGPGGAPVTALVTNDGVIRADGGTVQLTAAAADGVLQSLVRAGGKISANSVGARTGTVTVAGIGGSVSVTGLIAATGRAAGTTGGEVAVNATGDVILAPTARINASGAAGGGTVAIGTTLRRAKGGPGTASSMTAANVAVRKGARIAANATAAGNGGTVTILSNSVTMMDGVIGAKGGPLSGNGGLVEISGPTLELSGKANVLAPNGTRGTILLDPTDLAIVATGSTSSSVDSEFNNGTLAFTAPDGSPPPSTVSNFTIENLGSFGDVVIQATGSIDVRAPITVFNALTIQAGTNLTIESGDSISAAGGMLLQAGVKSATGALLVNADLTVSNSTGTIQLTSGTGGIALNANLSAPTVDLDTTGGGVTQASGVGITTGLLTSSTGVTGTASLNGSLNAISNLDTFTVLPGGAAGADFQLTTTDPLTVLGPVTAASGNVFLRTTDPEGIDIYVSGAVTAGGRASVEADAFFVTTGEGSGGTVVAGTFELAPNTPGAIVTVGSYTEGGLYLENLNGITATTIRVGSVTPPNGSTPTITAGSIDIAGTFDAQNAALELDATGGVTEETASPLINVSTLSGTAGAWSLNDPNNAIANIGTVNAAGFALTDTIGLTIVGTIASTGPVTIGDTGTLAVNGGIGATSVALTAGAIAIPGQVSAGTTGVVDLTANTGTINETGTLIANVLYGSAVGAVDLLGAAPSANQITTVTTPGVIGTNFGPRDLTGSSVAVRDGIGMTVGGAITATGATGQVYLESTAPAGIAVGKAGSVNADTTGGTISLQADSLTINGSATAATVQLAPATSGLTVTLGTSGNGLSVPSLTGVTAGTVVLGGVTQPAGAFTTTAGSIAVDGPLAFGGAATVALYAASSTAAGASGAITQTAPLTGFTTLTGSGDSIDLTNAGNAFTYAAGLTATAGNLSLLSGQALSIATVSAPAGNVWLSSSAPGGVTIDGPLTASGIAGVQADAFGFGASVPSSVTAAVFELAPYTSGATVTLGASTGLSLNSLTFIHATTVRVGAVTPPGGTAPVTTAGAVTIAAAFDAAATSVLELDAAALSGASGAISQSAALTNVATLVATGASIVLTNPGNTITTSSGMTATGGDLALIDDTTLTLNGAYSGTDLFFEVAAAGANLTIGGTAPASLTSAASGRISLIADSLTANVAGSIGAAAGTVELAPFSALTVSLAGTAAAGVAPIGTGLLADIGVASGTLLVGGFTNPPGAALGFTTTANAIRLDGTVNLTGRAGTLNLIANGAVTQPGGPLLVGTVTGSSVGDFSLNNPTNNIQASTGITASGGNVVLVDDPTLLLTGLYSGANLFFEVTQPAGSLQLGAVANPATLVAGTGGRISLVADSLSETTASTLSAPLGTLEVAPFSAINESVLGTNGSGQLLVDGTLLADITGSLATLSIGEYTPPQAVTPTISAASITVDGTLALTALANTLALFANGSVSETGQVTVNAVTGGGGTGFALTASTNAIGEAQGLTSSGGDVSVVDGTSLTLIGPQTAKDLFYEVALAGGTLQLGLTRTPATLTAATGGRVSLVADQTAVSGASTITAPAGTLEVAPFSSINISLLGTGSGQLVIGPALLASITPGLGTLTAGGFTNVPAGAKTSAPSASGLSIDGTLALSGLASALNLRTTGPITQTAPITGVGTLTATGSEVTLTNAGNQITTAAGIAATAGDIALTDGTSLTLNGAYTGANLFFQVAAAGGTLTVGGSSPATLASTGTRIALVADNLTANVAGSIGTAGGTVELAPFSTIPVSLAGAGSAGTMLIGAGLLADIDVGAGTLRVGGFTNPPGGSPGITTTAAAISLDGAVTLTGRAGTLILQANGPVTEPAGPLTVGTVTGSSIGDFSLNNPSNNIQASTGITASGGDVVLVDDPTLLLTGPYNGANLFFEVDQPGGSIQLGAVANPAVLTASANGRISLVADSLSETAASTIVAPNGTLEVAPFSAINESVAGTSGSGQLLVDGTLLADISDGLNTLVLGEYTVPRASISRVSASGITIDGPVALSGPLANLELVANGPVTEPGGPMTVNSVYGSSTGDFALTNPANAFARAATITATGGNVTLIDGTSLALTGAQTGGNLFVEVATAGGTLQLGSDDAPSALTAASGGRISLVADTMTVGGGTTITAPSGTLELAPFSAINTSLLGTASGQLNIGQPLLSAVTPGLATLTIGGFTPIGSQASTPSAASVSVNGVTTIGPLATTLNFEATGAVTQTAPIQNVTTLTGATGATTLTNPNNTVATLGNYAAGNGFALSNATNLEIAGTLTAGPVATLSIAGTLTETGAISAGTLSGSAYGTANLTGGNTIAALNGFNVSGPAGTFTLNDTVNLLIAGTTTANRIVISDPSALVSLGNGAAIVTGGSARPSGLTVPASLLPGNGAPGAFIRAAQFMQNGQSTVSGMNGGPSTVEISVTGDIRFDSRAGLRAPGTWLVLNLANGIATGNVFVNALDVSYAPLGSVNLFGAIDGVTSPSAARLGYIQPTENPNYRFNGCEIALAGCGTQNIQTPPLIVTVVYVPIDALLALVSPALVLDPEDNDDLLQMPVVSKEDY